MGESARLRLPLLQPGQAQKEITHNEALALIDIAVEPRVVAIDLNTPPGAPTSGTCWGVGAAPTGAWAGYGGAIAGWTDGGWRFVVPVAGFAVTREGDGVPFRYDGAQWVAADLVGKRVVVDGKSVVGPRRPAIAAVAGGGVVDDQARTTITSILGVLRQHGLIEE